MSRKPKTRVQKIVRLAGNTFGNRKITEQEADELLNKYATGRGQQMRGEVIALAIEKFMAHLPQAIRANLESSVRDLSQNSSNFGRFRSRAFIALMAVYQNGSVSGATSGKAFDIEALIKEAADEIVKKSGLDS